MATAVNQRAVRELLESFFGGGPSGDDNVNCFSEAYEGDEEYPIGIADH